MHLVVWPHSNNAHLVYAQVTDINFPDKYHSSRRYGAPNFVEFCIIIHSKIDNISPILNDRKCNVHRPTSHETDGICALFQYVPLISDTEKRSSAMSLANSLIYLVQSRSQLGGVDFVASLAPALPPKITKWTVCQCNLMTDTDPQRFSS